MNVCLLLLVLPSVVTLNIKIGLLTYTSQHTGADAIGPFESTASGVTLALDKAYKQGIMRNVNFSVVWKDDRCNAKDGVAAALQMYAEEKVDVFLGPMCSTVTTTIGYYASYWNVPVITHGSSDPVLSNKKLYDTLIRVRPSYDKIGYAFLEIMQHFSWSLVAVVISDYWQCDFGARSIMNRFDNNNITIAEWVRTVDSISDIRINNILERISERARIIIFCTREENIRRFVEQARRRGMTDGDYVFIYYTLFPSDFILTPWKDGGAVSAKEKKAYHVVKMMTMAALSGREAEAFMTLALQKMREPPWNLNSSMAENLEPSVSSILLYDSTYMYLRIIDEMMREGEDFRNGRKVFEKVKGRIFNGITGSVVFDENADREPDFLIWHYKEQTDRFATWTKISMSNRVGQRINPTREAFWSSSDSRPPPDRPECGFQYELCPDDPTTRNAIIIGVTLTTLVIVIAVAGFVYLHRFYEIRRRKLENELDQMLWRVKFEDIQFTKSKTPGSMMSVRSIQSLISSQRSRGSSSKGSDSRQTSSAAHERQLYAKVGVYKGILVAVKHIARESVLLSRKDHIELKAMRELSHENINPFVGACIESPNICILTVYCPKGSLEDILGNEDIKLDWMFKSSLMSDLVSGMIYLQASPLSSHGNLRSSACLVDARWVLKISDYGMHCVRFGAQHDDIGDYERYRKLLWTAPELLRMPNRPPEGTTKGDVYSYGIILQEILFRAMPFFLDTTQPREVVERVRAGLDPPYRPVLPKPQDDQERKTLELMVACWAEDPNARPDFDKVMYKLRAIHGGKKLNIMDTMLNKLEKYATNLEEIVAQRTVELVEEKKKTDSLLYRMLPPMVADSLKLGKTVEAEMYDAVTVYFSDIVGFTQLSSESTPMQVVDLLNDLYTLFDDTIQLHDVYKIETIGDAYMVVSGIRHATVETIGDAYMVVSGLPRRNGNKHAAEIANMALDLLSEITYFKVRHRPELQLRLRIGIHTGPCAAGVVGLTMPRYCLFGDTVNMASRMESNGNALKIHMSSQAHDALDQLHEGYRMVLRGEMDIKGKGLQKTFWLIGKDGYNKELPHDTIYP